MFRIRLRTIVQILTVIGMAVVLLLALLSARNNGQKKAHAEAVEKNMVEVQKSLSLFYYHQDRFPTVEEFNDRSERAVMKHYTLPWPLPELVLGTCANNFIYKRLTLASYELRVCTEVNYGSLHKGWNVIQGVQ